LSILTHERGFLVETAVNEKGVSCVSTDHHQKVPV
jgi:hypothetical protein